MKPAQDLLPLETIALEELTDADVEFIVHAANAYPKLVEEVRAMLAYLGPRVGGTGGKGDTEIVPHATALLRELGEEA